MSHACLLVAVVCGPDEDEIHEAVSQQMMPFDENGEWFAEGSRWDWWVIGGRYSGRFNGFDVIQRKDVDLDALRESNRRMHAENYDEANTRDAVVRSFMGVEPGETREQYIERHLTDFPQFYAFLRDRQWHEKGRLGWFGSEAKTECEVADPEHEGRCIHEHKDPSAKIFSWGEQHWHERFFGRFVQRLDQETRLVVVDYHV